MIDLIAQIGITAFGLAAIWLVTYKNPNIRKWGYLCGLLSEPFWVITLIYHHQWIVVFTVVVYTWAWWRGVYIHWKK